MIKCDKLEKEFMEPWKEIGLTEEQWRKPMHELSPEHRKVIFDVYNTKFKLNLSPELFNIPRSTVASDDIEF